MFYIFFLFNFAHLYRLFDFLLQITYTKKDDYLLPNKKKFLFLTNTSAYFSLLYARNLPTWLPRTADTFQSLFREA